MASRRAWDDDSTWGKVKDYILPNPQEWGIDKASRENRTRQRDINEYGWSSGIIHFRDNRQMMQCCLIGGSCIQHGHNQDLLDNTGCCIPCMEACVLPCCCWELHRTRKDSRARLGIKGVWFVDLCLVCVCPCLTTCQETRELELRTGKAWHPVWGFRLKQSYHSSLVYGGTDSFMGELCCGEERLTLTVPFQITPITLEKSEVAAEEVQLEDEDEDREKALAKLKAASILNAKTHPGSRPGTEEANLARTLQRNGTAASMGTRGNTASTQPGEPEGARATSPTFPGEIPASPGQYPPSRTQSTKPPLARNKMT